MRFLRLRMLRRRFFSGSLSSFSSYGSCSAVRASVGAARELPSGNTANGSLLAAAAVHTSAVCAPRCMYHMLGNGAVFAGPDLNPSGAWYVYRRLKGATKNGTTFAAENAAEKYALVYTAAQKSHARTR